MTDSLAQQVVLITGASAGIGAATAQQIATQFPGVRLVLAARSTDKLEAVAAHCQRAGATVLVVPTDMAELEQVQTLYRAALNRFGRIDAIVNNAGYGQMGPLELIPSEAVDRQFQVNLLGPIGLIQALIPTFREQGGGRIVNVSSLGGRAAFPFGSLYSASKFALEGLSDALRRELQPFNIQVALVEPGPVKTEFFTVANQQADKIVPHPEDTLYRAAFQRLADLDRQIDKLAWTPEQVAEVVMQALSDRHPKARYVAATGGEFGISFLTKVLPTPVSDRFWRKFYGVDQVSKDWQERQA